MNTSPTSPQASPAATGAARPAVLPVGFKDLATLLAAYMPLLADGGLFVPTRDEYPLGQEVYLLLTLPEDSQRYPLTGRIAWITPPGADHGRLPGVGVGFCADPQGRQMKARIEALLGASLGGDRPTLTF
ncbi:MAG: PilZ domain-containing protein [Comamonas sp.]